MIITRRHFLAQLSSVAALSLTGPKLLWANETKQKGLTEIPAIKFHLADGFKSILISDSGDMMSDGILLPRLPDGMACFDLEDGRWALVRNHEIAANGESPLVPGMAYDPKCPGGTTTVHMDHQLKVLKQFGF